MTALHEQLAPSPDIYYALTAHTTDLVTILEADGTIRYASPSFQRLLGYAPAALQGTNAFALVHPEDVESVRATFTAAAQADDGTPVRVQCRYRHADGSWRIIATTGSSHLADPLVRGFIATSQDVTDQLHAAEQLGEKEAQYRSIFDASGDGLIIADLDDTVVEANPAICRMFGYSYDELIGRRVDLHQADGSAPYQARAINRRTDGTLFTVEGHATIFAYKGTPHRLGVVRDVTARVQAEEQLREKEAQYRGVFDATTDGVSIVDMDGYIVEVNPAYCTLYGYSHDELIGLHASALAHPDYLHLLAESFQTIAAGGSVRLQAMSLRKDGTPFHVEAHGTTFTYKGKMHVLGLVRDVTERVRAQELLEQRVAERTRELSALLEVSHNVASTLEVQSLLALILDQLKVVTEYSAATILILDGDELRVVGYQGPSPREEMLRARYGLKPGGIDDSVLRR